MNGENGLDALGCESASDCGEDQVCASTDIIETDETHAEFSEEADALMQSMFPLTVCVSGDECEELANTD